jgi:hypothetical protein
MIEFESRVPRRVLPALMAGVLGLVSGCAVLGPDCGCALDPENPGCKAAEPVKVEYALAEAQSAYTAGKKSSVEISDTPTYRDARQTLATAAIRLPDSCLNDSAATVRGDAQVQTIAQTQCGVWLSELEKALVHARFRVVSWDALHGLEQSKRLPAYEAAKELGADVLFLFNSLEVSEVQPGSESVSRIEYFRSDERGGKGVPFAMTDYERSALREVVKGKMKIASQASVGKAVALSSTLDSTAVTTSSGESMWFYRNTAAEPLIDSSGQAFLFARYQGRWFLAHRATDAQPLLAPVAPTVSAVDVDEQSTASTKDPYAVQRLSLVRAVAQDFVGRFRDGLPGDPK